MQTPDIKFLQTANDIADEVYAWAKLIARKEGTPDTLQGLCARASARVFKHLTARGYDATICYTYNALRGHVFIMCNEYVIDVTAAQFRTEHTIIIRPWEHDLPWYWSKINREMEELWELEDWTCEWGDGQQVQRGDYEIFYN